MAHEEPAAPEAGAADAAPKSKMPMIVAIVAGLAVGSGSGFAVVKPMLVKKFTAASVAAVSDTTAAHGAEGEGGGGEHGAAADGKGEAAAPPVMTLENLVLNPSGSGGSRYLLMSIAIECADTKAMKSLQDREAELKDVILTALGHKNVDELSDVTNKAKIKTELAAAIDERFGKSSVKQIYFPQFVIQ